MRLIVSIKGIYRKDGGQILTKADYIPRKGDTMLWKDMRYNIVDVEWFMSGEGFEKKLEISTVVIEPINTEEIKKS